MPDFAAPLASLIQEVKRLPGIGQKSAQRIAFQFCAPSAMTSSGWRTALLDVKDKLGLCAQCNNISDASCAPTAAIRIATDSVICVVEEPHNILPIETTRQFSGLYHVLHGSISPLRGIGPEQLKIKGLIERLQSGATKEIILATNPTVEGEATAVYLSRLLKPLGVRVTRIAMGIPVGSDLEFADEVTMIKSLENRRDL